MTADLAGLRVSVLLNEPYNKRIEGRVSDVKNRQLFLQDVLFENGSRAGYFVIPGQDICDLEVIRQPQAPQALQHVPSVQSPTYPQFDGHNNQPVRTPVQQDFSDPAILSYGKPPRTAPQHHDPAIASFSGAQSRQPAGVEPNMSATLSRPFNTLSITTNDTAQSVAQAMQVASGHQPQDSIDIPPTQPKRRRQKKRAAVPAAVVENGQNDSSPELTRPTLATAPSAKPASGWRQTPILQEIPAKPAAVKDLKAKKKQRQRQRVLGAPGDDGFGTEDATDIQALEEFDFVGNLSKFDKKAVFEQLRNEDTTADEDLLVNHNRLARPGTFQGTKLHPFENVLQRQRKDSNDIYGSDGGSDTAAAYGSRPPYRAGSRSSSKKRVQPRSGSKRSDKSFERSSSKDPGAGNSTSPRPANRPVFKYASGRVAPCVWPEDLQDAEDLALSDEFSLSYDVLAENAGRAIADLSLSTISPDGRRFAPGNINTRPVVVILVGEERPAARAIAAGRHLQARGIRVIATAVDKRLVKSVDEEGPLAAQLYRLKGDLMTWDDASQYLKTLDAPPELIIDALGGEKDLMLQLLSGEEAPHVKNTAFQMMAWANKSRASCLAVDCPFGVNPTTGQVLVHEGEPAEIRAKVVACCGAPLAGVLASVQNRHEQATPESWRVMVCDIGIDPALRQITQDRMGTGRGRGIAFGPQWTVKLQFEPSDA